MEAVLIDPAENGGTFSTDTARRVGLIEAQRCEPSDLGALPEVYLDVPGLPLLAGPVAPHTR